MFEDGELHEYRCLVGHAYSPQTLLSAHSETQEKALWSAVVALEEATELVEATTDAFPAEAVERFRAQAALKKQQAAQIRNIIEHLEPFRAD